MPDVYASITEIDSEIVDRIAHALEVRAADRQQQWMLESYLSQIAFPPDARVLEIGCGTGAISRRLASWPQIGEVVGLDPSSVLLAKGESLASDVANVSFKQGDGRNLSFEDESFDAVICHTTLSHVPNPSEVLAEARRVLRSNGYVAVFDGDYATTTVSIGDNDPLQRCVVEFLANFVHDKWLVRRLPNLMRQAGFTQIHGQSYGYLENESPDYMLTIVDRGVDVLLAQGRIGESAASALKAEARHRSESNSFFGFIAYASFICQKQVAGNQA